MKQSASAEVKNGGAIPVLLRYAFVACTGKTFPVHLKGIILRYSDTNLCRIFISPPCESSYCLQCIHSRWRTRRPCERSLMAIGRVSVHIDPIYFDISDTHLLACPCRWYYSQLTFHSLMTLTSLLSVLPKVGWCLYLEDSQEFRQQRWRNKINRDYVYIILLQRVAAFVAGLSLGNVKNTQRTFTYKLLEYFYHIAHISALQNMGAV